MYGDIKQLESENDRFFCENKELRKKVKKLEHIIYGRKWNERIEIMWIIINFTYLINKFNFIIKLKYIIMSFTDFGSQLFISHDY
jgi:hypothetical protein